ncbi:MAG: hypothetical protein SVZ03_16875 [Spirochaetota bacterium]|nr:hypothetical protein [Spirochaetota bacterium]
MKILGILLLVVSIIFISTDKSYSRAMGVKGGYAKMMDDYSDLEFDDTWTLGILFDLGTFIFNSLRFRPSIDYVEMAIDDTELFDVYAFHIDWYWFFLKKSTVSPFLGFGPALNYLDYEDDTTTDEDSDAGIEGFGGIEFDINGPLSMIFEVRFLFHDIADRDKTMLKLTFGLLYSF